MRNLPLTLTITAVLGLAACQQKTPPADSVPAPASTEAESAAKATAASPVDTGATLIVEPGFVTTCKDGDRTTSSVRWQVTKPGVSTVRIEVNGPDDAARKTFAMGGATGEAQTGNWVGAGVRFHLVDTASGAELASYTVGLKPCEASGA